MTKHIFCFLAVLIFTVGLVGQVSAQPDKQTKDGFYLIYRIGNTDKQILPLAEKETIIPISELLIAKTDPGITFVVVDKYDYVPMLLSEKPTTIEQEDNKLQLLLTLTEEASVRLAEFTGKHLNKIACIVVNGEALTLHKIRTVIEDGKMQITRCTDNACEILYSILEKNVVD